MFTENRLKIPLFRESWAIELTGRHIPKPLTCYVPLMGHKVPKVKRYQDATQCPFSTPQNQIQLITRRQLSGSNCSIIDLAPEMLR